MMDILSKIFVRGLLLAAFGLPVTARADTIELHDGSKIEAESLTFKDGQVVLDDGRTLPRDEIKKISFKRGASTEAAPAKVVDSDVQELLRKAAKAQEKYPDVGAITLIDEGEFVLRPDGTQWERSHHAVKILKEPWKSAGQIGNWYEEGRNRATLVRARTISPDGEIHEFDPADLKESKPTGGMVSFQKYKTLSGQLPEVEIGSIVEVIWERETYNPYDKELFFPRWYFGGTEPSLSSRVTVRVPRDRTLHYRVENLKGEAAEPKVTEEGEDRVYRWAMSDIEHIVREPRMPPVYQETAYLRASLFTDWEYIFDFLGKFQREHIEVTPELEAKVAEIIGDAQTPEEKLTRIYHWLQREIRYISIKGSMGSGWSGHPATLTLKNKYGDCIDKAILSTAMLKAVGIKASPVIIATNFAPADDRSVPTLYGNHAITKVYLDDKPFYLDTTATTYRYPYFRSDDHGVTAINVLEREIGFVDVPPPADNRIDVNLDMSVDAEGNVDAVVSLEMNGMIEAYLRQGLEELNKMMLKMIAQQFVNQISPGAELQEITTSDEKDLNTPVTVTMKIRFPEYPTFAGDLMIFKLPVSDMIYQFDEAALAERQFDIQYMTSLQIHRRMRIDLPEGYVPKGLPEPINFKTRYADFQAGYRKDGETLVYEDNLSRSHRIVPQADYGKYKEFLEEVADFAQEPLFLYKVKQDPAS